MSSKEMLPYLVVHGKFTRGRLRLGFPDRDYGPQTIVEADPDLKDDTFLERSRFFNARWPLA